MDRRLKNGGIWLNRSELNRLKKEIKEIIL